MGETQEEFKVRLAKLRAKNENKICIDCPGKNPNWATLTYGAFICMDCASQHRSMGVHITFVRSTVLDTWDEAQTTRMEQGGNAKARAFFKTHGVQDMKNKYSSLAAKQYKAQLDKLCAGAKGAPAKEEWKEMEEEKPVQPVTPKEPASPLSSPPPSSPMTPATPLEPEVPKPKIASKQASATAISGSLGRRPATGTKKKGLGGMGAQRVAHGSVKVTTGPVPDEEPEEKKEEKKASTTSASTSKSSTSGKPDFSGLGSDGPAKSVSTASTIDNNKVYEKKGPDFGGVGSAGSNAASSKSDVGIDVGDLAWAVGDKAAKAKASMSASVDRFSGSIKGFLDDL